MLEDKLRHDERVRLECLAQANLTIQGRPASRIVAAEELGGSIVELARQYETFVLGPAEGPHGPGEVCYGPDCICRYTNKAVAGTTEEQHP